MYISLFNIFRDWDVDLRNVTHFLFFYACIILFIFLCTVSLNRFVTPWISVLETQIVAQLVNNFSEFYGIRSFITVCTVSDHMFLSLSISIQLTTSFCFLTINLNIPSSTPRDSKWSLSLRFPHQNSVRNSPLPERSHMPRPSPNFTTRIMFAEE